MIDPVGLLNLNLAVYNIQKELDETFDNHFDFYFTGNGFDYFVYFSGIELWNSIDDERHFYENGKPESIEHHLRERLDEEINNIYLLNPLKRKIK